MTNLRKHKHEKKNQRFKARKEGMPITWLSVQQTNPPLPH